MESEPTGAPEELDAARPELREYLTMEMRVVRLSDTEVVPLLAGLTHEDTRSICANIE